MPEQERGTKPDMSVLPKLYSIEDVLSIFPTNHKPGIRRLSALRGDKQDESVASIKMRRPVGS